MAGAAMLAVVALVAVVGGPSVAAGPAAVGGPAGAMDGPLASEVANGDQTVPRPVATVVDPRASAIVPGPSAPHSVAAAAASGRPVATNGLAEFSIKPGGTVAEPGETVPLLVFLRSSPQVASGAYEAGFVLAYDPSVLRATNVTRGRFMQRGEETSVVVNRSVVDDEAGVVRYGLEREPPNGGVTGYARFATVTFEVRPDAPPGQYDVAFERARVLLTDDGYQRVTTYGSTVTVTWSATPTATETSTATRNSATGTAVAVAAVLGTLVVLAGVVMVLRRV